METIKTCPFCGSEADVQNDFGRVFWVQCKDLTCGSTDGTEHAQEAEAIANWNRRAALAKQAEAAQHSIVDDLAMLVRQLVHSLSKAAPSHALPARALDYLQRKGLQGSPLRAPMMIDNGIEQAAKFIEKKAENYDADCGMSDPETGAREYPGDGAEYFNGLMELAEEIRALSSAPPPQPDSERDAALSNENCDDAAQSVLTTDGFSRYLNGDTVKLDAIAIRQIIYAAMDAQQGENGGAK